MGHRPGRAGCNPPFHVFIKAFHHRLSPARGHNCEPAHKSIPFLSEFPFEKNIKPFLFYHRIMNETRNFFFIK